MKWCLNVKNGIELVEPNNNMSNSYLKMAEESLRVIKNLEESKLWTASALYYVMYYSLYSIMIRIGVKCEIHKCSIKFMEKYLLDFYGMEDIKLIEMAFEMRNDLQYYPDKLINEKRFGFVKSEAVDFFVKTKEILVKITEKEINKIREILKNE